LAKAFPVKNPKTFHDWVRNQFGERLFSIFFKTYTEKVWGMGCDEISADWAAQRIKGLSLGAAILDGLRRSLGRRKNVGTEDGPKTLIESFRYPRRGRNDVGSCRQKDESDGRPHPHGPRARAPDLR
jgi:protoporphyrinogen oxidase